MATTVTYKGATLTTVDNDTKTLQTSGTWLEDDITLTDVSGGGTGEWTTTGIATNTEPNGAIVLDNTITTLADNAFRGKPITSIIGGGITNVGMDALNGTQITSITDTNFPVLGVNTQYIMLLRTPNSCTKIKLTGKYIGLSSGSSALRNCTGLKSAEFPHCAESVGSSYKGTGQYVMGGCTNLELADLGLVNNLSANAFNGDTKLETIILRNSSVVALSNINAFTNTPFKSGGTGGHIYIPKSLYDHLGDGTSSDYRNATNWSTIHGYGTITWHAIEGSIYE